MQKSSKKVLSACSVASLLIAGTALPTAGVKAADSSDAINRLGGQNRYETAAKVAQYGWTSSDYAIVANGEGYADALCAIPLAKAKDAPVLLTTGDNLNENALNELKSLNVKHVIVIGGTGVVSENALNDIKAQVSDVQRLGGQDRYETSVKIAQALASTSAKAVVASGEGYADALSAGPAAAINGMPILLTRQNSLPDVEADYFKSNSNITATYVIGGTASVSDSVANSLPSPKRLSGTDRYETNVAVLKEFASDFNFGSIYAALGNGPTGNEFADALTGGALAAKNKNPLIITGYTLSSATADFLKDEGYSGTKLTVLGGTLNISDSLADSIKGSFGTGTTPGTGGGGGGTTTGKNLISDLKGSGTLGAVYNNYVNNRVNSDTGDLYNSFFGIDLGGSADDPNSINVDLKDQGTNEQVNTLSGIFANAATRYDIDNDGKLSAEGVTKLQSDVGRINTKLSTSLSNVKINDISLKGFFGDLGSQYFDENGNLIASTIQKTIEDKNIQNGYDNFKTDLQGQINAYFTTNTEIANEPSKLTYTVKNGNITLYTATITSITKLGTGSIYSGGTVSKAVNDLVDNLLFSKNATVNNTDYTGTYTVYLSTGDYVNMKVNPYK